MKSLKHDGTQSALPFSEKGGKSLQIPVWDEVEQISLSMFDWSCRPNQTRRAFSIGREFLQQYGDGLAE
jgi:hypothetical protein